MVTSKFDSKIMTERNLGPARWAIWMPNVIGVSLVTMWRQCGSCYSKRNRMIT